MKTKVYRGIAASPGIIIGDAFVYDSKRHIVEKTRILPKDVPVEIKKLKDAIEVSKKEILDIKETVNEELGETQAAIFNFHYMMLNDPQIINTTVDTIENES